MQSHKDCLIVLDTLGVQADCAILGISACRFDLDRPELEAVQFDCPISADSNRCANRTYDGETLAWWAERGDVIDVFTRDGVTLEEALDSFSTFYHGADQLYILGRGFELPALAHAYHQLKQEPPWPCYAVRDGRMLCDINCWLSGVHADVTPRGKTTVETLARRHIALQRAYSSLRVFARSKLQGVA